MIDVDGTGTPYVLARSDVMRAARRLEKAYRRTIGLDAKFCVNILCHNYGKGYPRYEPLVTFEGSKKDDIYRSKVLSSEEKEKLKCLKKIHAEEIEEHLKRLREAARTLALQLQLGSQQGFSFFVNMRYEKDKFNISIEQTGSTFILSEVGINCTPT